MVAVADATVVATRPSVRVEVTGTNVEAVEAIEAALRSLKPGGAPAPRPGRVAGWGRRPEERVTVALTGKLRPVLAAARALADVVVVTGMSHHVTDGPGSTGDPVVRVELACYPPRRVGGVA